MKTLPTGGGPSKCATGEFIGFAGLDRVDDGLPFTGVEAGRRHPEAPAGPLRRNVVYRIQT